ncbi:MAG: site-specific integrase [Mycoplasma sp.]|nr:site-specific integrase [Mycoplasma sp.]
MNSFEQKKEKNILKKEIIIKYKKLILRSVGLFYYLNMTYKKFLEKIKNYSNRTIEIYIKYAKLLERYKLNYKSMLLASENISINTKRLMISAIKSYYKFLKDERYKEIELPRKEVLVKEFVSFEEYKKYLSIINRKTKMGFQKRIIIRLLFETGIRSSELLKLNKKNIKNNELHIFGKGRRQRKVMISEWLLEELNEYLKTSNEVLFPFGYKNLYNKVKLLDKERKLSPHMFRRGYAKYCFEKGVNIYDISLSMGHSNIETTVGYIKRNSEDVEIYKIF